MGFVRLPRFCFLFIDEIKPRIDGVSEETATGQWDNAPGTCGANESILCVLIKTLFGISPQQTRESLLRVLHSSPLTRELVGISRLWASPPVAMSDLMLVIDGAMREKPNSGKLIFDKIIDHE